MISDRTEINKLTFEELVARRKELETHERYAPIYNDIVCMYEFWASRAFDLERRLQELEHTMYNFRRNKLIQEGYQP